MGEVLGLAPADCPPFPHPLMLAGDRAAWFPNAFAPGHYTMLPICDGLAMGWAPAAELGGVVLCLHGGNAAAPTGEVIATLLSRRGLKRLIGDLQSIDRQLNERP
jgi:hypothetical protein